MSKIIGISPTHNHDSGAALFADGEIKYAIEEEKLTGIKSCYSWDLFPSMSLASIDRMTGVNLFNCDHIAIPRIFSVKDFPKEYQTQDIIKKVKSYSHHMCHALGSYYTSGMDGK